MCFVAVLGTGRNVNAESFRFNQLSRPYSRSSEALWPGAERSAFSLSFAAQFLVQEPLDILQVIPGAMKKSMAASAIITNALHLFFVLSQDTVQCVEIILKLGLIAFLDQKQDRRIFSVEI
jgi:hypothetical protein